MTEPSTRKDEATVKTDRMERTYNINNLWYFELRGGGQQGPFDSEEEMQAALEEFIKLNKEFQN
ncbi:MAG: DUF6316 family protein [Gammaproteobacteria bacterium]|nr:DUF6316 family protein [Gammaproteobacteria bacterium]